MTVQLADILLSGLARRLEEGARRWRHRAVGRFSRCARAWSAVGAAAQFLATEGHPADPLFHIAAEPQQMARERAARSGTATKRAGRRANHEKRYDAFIRAGIGAAWPDFKVCGESKKRRRIPAPLHSSFPARCVSRNPGQRGEGRQERGTTPRKPPAESGRGRHSPRLSLPERQPRNADVTSEFHSFRYATDVKPAAFPKAGVSRSAPHGVSVTGPSDMQLLVLFTRGPVKSPSPGNTSRPAQSAF